mmetsp:Transcript_15044/g.35599  ORF Transcript_15044/g.35599 Transcript_15044/m.35599 type:complete len:82 (+) Transcript_15044:245-490(+)
MTSARLTARLHQQWLVAWPSASSTFSAPFRTLGHSVATEANTWRSYGRRKAESCYLRSSSPSWVDGASIPKAEPKETKAKK